MSQKKPIKKSNLSASFCSIYDVRGKTVLPLCFLVQLAICIERKRELNEDYQDCVESMDNASPRIKVTMVSLFTLLFECLYCLLHFHSCIWLQVLV